MNREDRRKAAQECKRKGHLNKTGDPRKPRYCARCGKPVDQQ